MFKSLSTCVWGNLPEFLSSPLWPPVSVLSCLSQAFIHPLYTTVIHPPLHHCYSPPSTPLSLLQWHLVCSSLWTACIVFQLKVQPWFQTRSLFITALNWNRSKNTTYGRPLNLPRSAEFVLKWHNHEKTRKLTIIKDNQR